MGLSAVEILKTQAELLTLPKGKERFDAYLAAMTGGTNDLVIPIGSFNPMSKDHVSLVVDRLVELNAERIVAEVVADLNSKFPNFQDAIKVGLVVVDDVKGGWTCRETIELERTTGVSGELKRHWISVLWWCSDDCTEDAVRLAATTQIFKAMEILNHGPVQTLGDWVDLEAQAMRLARVTPSPAEHDWFNKFKSFTSAQDTPTLVSAIYGDPAAEKLGYIPLGFPTDAGSIFAKSLLSPTEIS
jgi:hypothetical protein